MKIKTFILIIFLGVSVSQPSYAGKFSFLGDFFDFVHGIFSGKHLFKNQNQDFEDINYENLNIDMACSFNAPFFIKSFEEEFDDFKNLFPPHSLTAYDVVENRLEKKIISILQFDTEIENNDYKKIWSIVEEELSLYINEHIKQFYEIDNVLINGFDDKKIPTYTCKAVRQFKNVQIAFNKN